MRFSGQLVFPKVVVGAVAVFALMSAGCKQRDDVSGLRDSTTAPATPGPKCSTGEQIDAMPVAGVGFIGTACGGSVCGGPNDMLSFRKIDRMSRDACATVARSIPFSSMGGISITVPSGGRISLTQNPNQNYSYTADRANCDDAMQMLGLTSGWQPGENCSVQLDTEDQYWFGVTVRPDSMQGTLGYDQTVDDANKAFLAQYSGPSSVAAPLVLFQQINSKVDPSVKDEMLRIHRAHQMRNSTPDTNAHRERNSCLRNARASNWTDLQSHYYCALPYEPHRKCYSTELVTRTEALKKARESGQVQITDVQYAAKVREFMEEAITSCRTKPGFRDFTDEQIGIFKYVMFTIAGVMDFNIEAENALINDFYEEVKSFDSQTPTRPTRITDTVPWRADQKRYADVRAMQAPRVKLGLAKRGCMTTGGTWDDTARSCACPRRMTFDPQTLACK